VEFRGWKRLPKGEGLVATLALPAYVFKDG
jgi:hypothetical protein